MTNRSVNHVFSVLFFILAAAAWGQNTFTTPPQTIVVNINIPPILKLSIDNTITNSITIAARYASPDIFLSPAPGLFVFDVSQGSEYQIGTIRIFSNMPESYALKIESINNGQMAAMDGRNTAAISYGIRVGAVPLGSYSGEFVLPLSGKTDQEGDEFVFLLDFGPLPENLPSGVYYDKLILSLSKE